MKTDIDPNFEYKENKDFRKEFFKGVALTLALAVMIALLLLAIAYDEVIDGVHPLVVVGAIFVCLGLGWAILNYSKDFKHNDQR